VITTSRFIIPSCKDIVYFQYVNQYFLGKVFVHMQIWPTWLIESIVQGSNHSPYLRIETCHDNSNSYAADATLCSLSTLQQDSCIPSYLLSRWVCSYALHICRFQFYSERLAQDISILDILRNVWLFPIVINQPLPGAYLCGPSSYGWTDYTMYPPLLFELTLVGLCLWAGYQHSKEHFSAPRLRWSRAHLIDILIRGNVFYFFR